MVNGMTVGIMVNVITVSVTVNNITVSIDMTSQDASILSSVFIKITLIIVTKSVDLFLGRLFYSSQYPVSRIHKGRHFGVINNQSEHAARKHVLYHRLNDSKQANV